MRKVILNSIPLIILSSIDKLNILKELYNEVYIPESVFREVTENQDSACAKIIEVPDWIHVERIENVEEKKMYRAKLHNSEVEVIVMAQEAGKDALAVIDDKVAKKTAKYLGIQVTGTLGVLLKAKEKGIISDIGPLLSEMRRIGFYVSDTLMNFVTQKAREE